MGTGLRTKSSDQSQTIDLLVVMNSGWKSLEFSAEHACVTDEKYEPSSKEIRGLLRTKSSYTKGDQ
jgi:hypothetical protein